MRPLFQSKKGILTSEILKIVLAVISISLLLYLSFNLYSTFTKSSKLNQAKATFEVIDSYMNVVIEDNGVDEVNFLIESPNDWGIFAWPFAFELEMPNQCEGENCVCICPLNGLGIVADIKEVSNSCDESGFCAKYGLKVKTLVFEDSSFSQKGLQIDGPFSLNISKKDDSISLIRRV